MKPRSRRTYTGLSNPAPVRRIQADGAEIDSARRRRQAAARIFRNLSLGECRWREAANSKGE